MGISATIITWNEEANIRACLESLAWVDEIVVCDAISEDATVAICQEHGAKVVREPWLGYARQKNRCLELASQDWILSVDADERVSPALRAEIERAAGSGEHDGYRIPRRNYFGGRWIRHGGWYPDYTLRLFRRGRGRFIDREVHEEVQVAGTVGTLREPLEHRTYRDIADFLHRMDRYSTLSALEYHKQGRRPRLMDLLLRPPATFLKMYLLRWGVLDGYAGFLLATLSACYTFAKYAKLRELATPR